MDQSETGTQLKIRILNASKKDLLRDLQRAPEFDQSAMFKKVYEEEYGPVSYTHLDVYKRQANTRVSSPGDLRVPAR